MKAFGVALVIIGILVILYPSIATQTGDQMAHMEDLATDMVHDRDANWELYIGIGVLIIGVAVFLAGGRTRRLQ